jgi:hypothetical protein
VVDSDASGEDQSRPPTLEDLLRLCRELNDAGASYIVIGGMAIIHLLGGGQTTLILGIIEFMLRRTF